MNKWKTEVKKNTLVPIYNESFQFDVSGLNIRNVSLEIWVMDYDRFSRNDKMGVVYVGANSPRKLVVITGWRLSVPLSTRPVTGTQLFLTLT